MAARANPIEINRGYRFGIVGRPALSADRLVMSESRFHMARAAAQVSNSQPV